MTKQRVILDAAIERSVIRGTLTTATGERREFHGWLELNTALEAILSTGAAHPRDYRAAAGAAAVDEARGTRRDTNSSNPLASGRGDRARATPGSQTANRR